MSTTISPHARRTGNRSFPHTVRFCRSRATSGFDSVVSRRSRGNRRAPARGHRRRRFARRRVFSRVFFFFFVFLRLYSCAPLHSKSQEYSCGRRRTQVRLIRPAEYCSAQLPGRMTSRRPRTSLSPRRRSRRTLTVSTICRRVRKLDALSAPTTTRDRRIGFRRRFRLYDCCCSNSERVEKNSVFRPERSTIQFLIDDGPQLRTRKNV